MRGPTQHGEGLVPIVGDQRLAFEQFLRVVRLRGRYARETNQPVPKLPILFNKYNNSLNCHQGTVQVSKLQATNFDYESELVIVMGRKAADVSEAERSGAPALPP